MLKIDTNRFRQALNDAFPDQSTEARALLLGVAPNVLDALTQTGHYDDPHCFAQLLKKLGHHNSDSFVVHSQRTAAPQRAPSAAAKSTTSRTTNRASSNAPPAGKRNQKFKKKKAINQRRLT